MLFSFTRKKDRKPKAIAFVDYEHWYISYEKMLHQKPDIRAWRNELAQRYDVQEILFFADFSNPALRAEIPRIREISSSIIETQNASPHHVKDYTDFILLDHIYQRAMFAQDIDVFVIFSGDGHFSSAASFLINRCNKTVGVYGVRECLSNQLRNTASYAVEVPEEQADPNSEYYALILQSLKSLQEKKGKNQYPTFWGTVDAVSAKNRIEKKPLADAMRSLIDGRYLSQREISVKNTRKKPSDGDAPEKINIKVLQVDWKKVARDHLLPD